jgi:hypothetical protein
MPNIRDEPALYLTRVLNVTHRPRVGEIWHSSITRWDVQIISIDEYPCQRVTYIGVNNFNNPAITTSIEKFISIFEKK